MLMQNLGCLKFSTTRSTRFACFLQEYLDWMLLLMVSTLIRLSMCATVWKLGDCAKICEFFVNNF